MFDINHGVVIRCSVFTLLILRTTKVCFGTYVLLTRKSGRPFGSDQADFEQLKNTLSLTVSDNDVDRVNFKLGYYQALPLLAISSVLLISKFQLHIVPTKIIALHFANFLLGRLIIILL